MPSSLCHSRRGAKLRRNRGAASLRQPPKTKGAGLLAGGSGLVALVSINLSGMSAFCLREEIPLPPPGDGWEMASPAQVFQACAFQDWDPPVPRRVGR
ncbi:exported hypothetical protein [Verrucomicrobia bacterium]|nr:exported hypothetical protein [Verrucomicrobiota bacterium]